MYAETSIPFVSRTRATLRSAEFGFFGVCVRTWVQTPRFCGAPFGCIRRRCFIELKVYCSAGALVLAFLNARPSSNSVFDSGRAPTHSCPRLSADGLLFYHARATAVKKLRKIARVGNRALRHATGTPGGPTHRLRPLRKAALPCSPCLRPPGDGIARGGKPDLEGVGA